MYFISNNFPKFEFSVAHTAFYKARISMVQFMCDVLNEKASAYRAATSYGPSMPQSPNTEALSPRRGRFQRGRGGTILTVNSEKQYHHLSLRITVENLVNYERQKVRIYRIKNYENSES